MRALRIVQSISALHKYYSYFLQSEKDRRVDSRPNSGRCSPHMTRGVLVALILIGLLQSPLYTVHAAPAENLSDATFHKLQDELRKEKHRKKVLSRFEEVEGLHGLTLEDISLTLLDYSYHTLNDSGKPEPFITVRCDIDISKFEKNAEKLRENLRSTGRQAPVHIQLPDSERTIFGMLDNAKDEFITLASLPNWLKAVVQFVELRKNRPEYIILTLEPADNCTKCDLIESLSTVVFGFDEQSKTYSEVLDVKTYRAVHAQDSPSAESVYIDKASVSWSDWIENEYRELIISTDREIKGANENATATFKNKREIYSWVNDKELILVERIIDGKSTISRRIRPLSTVEVTLKDGELYEISGKVGYRSELLALSLIGNQITFTGGKIDSFILSPDKHYVAYSVIVGYTDDAGDYESDEMIPQVPLYHIVVMDLDLKKELKVIKPPIEQEPFIIADRWISTDELLLHDADGLVVCWQYIYSAGTNELRRADIHELSE